MMKGKSKEDIQTYSAIAMLACGSVMAFISLLLPPIGEISNGALWYTGQCFLYAGGIFGIGTWAKSRIEDMDRRIDSRFRGEVMDGC